MQEVERKFYLEVYGNYCLHIIVTDNIDESRNTKSRIKLLGQECKLDDSTTGLHSFNPKTHAMESFIFICPKSSADTMPHEALHAVIRIMNQIGAYLDEASEESYCYLLGYIYTKIIQVVNIWIDKFENND